MRTISLVRVTDKIGELDVETAEKKDTGEEDTDETLDQPSVNLTMESSKDNQQIHVTTPGSFKMTTTEADEISVSSETGSDFGQEPMTLRSGSTWLLVLSKPSFQAAIT